MYQKSSLLTCFLSSIIAKTVFSFICTKYSKIHRRLLTLFSQSSIIALIEIFRKGKYHVYKIKQTFIGRLLKSLTEGEGGLLGKCNGHVIKRRSIFHCLGPEQESSLLWSLPLAIWWSLLYSLSSCSCAIWTVSPTDHAYPQGGGPCYATSKIYLPS